MQGARMTGILPTVIAEQLSASFPKVVIGNLTTHTVIPEGCNRESVVF